MYKYIYICIMYIYIYIYIYTSPPDLLHRHLDISTTLPLLLIPYWGLWRRKDPPLGPGAPEGGVSR